MITKDEFDIWSNRQKAKTLWLGGLRFFYRDSAGGLIIASRHWRHLCCWSWLLSFKLLHRSEKPWTFGRDRHNGGGWVGANVGRYGIRWGWQTYDRIASSRFKDMKINWDREKGRNTILASIEEWPVKRPVIRTELLKQDRCPDCGGSLDTGWECNDCGFDGRSDERFDAYIRREIAIEKANAQAA